MEKRGVARRLAVFGLVIAVVANPAVAQTPVGVSPGEVDRTTAIEGRCPTFIWGDVAGAQGYELVVYRLPDDPGSREGHALELSPDDQALFAALPAGVTGWQPDLDRALDPGASYVWFVRAVLREEAGEVLETSDWSRGRLFAVSGSPSPAAIEQALEVLRRASAGRRGGEPAVEPSPDGRPRAPAGTAASRRSADTPDHLKSVPTATAATRSTVGGSTGETYGVVGISGSPDGAGVGAVNTAGGPDLVLDGSEDVAVDAELSESGVDRPSGTPQTFDITNSLGAGMTLRVDGAAVTTVESDLDAGKLTTGTVPDGRLAGTYSGALSLTNPSNELAGSGAALTGVDADTLDGTDGAAYATDVEAAGLVAAHAASADHDGRYFTETELGTSGAGGAVHWGNLTAVPSGFADGVDNDTVYTMGPGLIADNGEIRIDPAAFSTRVSTLDGSGGNYSSVAIGVDGLGLISYQRGSNDLAVAHCDDILCTGASVTTLDSAAGVGKYTSLAIGADGLGVISYFDEALGDLKVAHCEDVACSNASISTVDSASYVGLYTSLAIGADGLPLISYYNASNQDLKIAHCNDVACSSATTPTLDSPGDVGQYTSLTIGGDGRGLISYYDATNADLKVAHCDDLACSTATIRLMSDPDDVGRYTSIATGHDGLGLISCWDSSLGDLKVVHCDDATCSSATSEVFWTTDSDGRYTSITVGDDGLGLVLFENFTGVDREIARCHDTACTSIARAGLGVCNGTNLASVVVGADGAPLISCIDGGLRVIHLGLGVP